MTVIRKLRFDDSWSPDRNVFYRAYYGDPVTLKTEISRLFYTLRQAIADLISMTYEDEELDNLVEDWCELLSDVSSEKLSYWEASATKTTLENLTEEFLPEIQKEIAVLKLRPKATATNQAPTGTLSTPSIETATQRKLKTTQSAGLDNDLVFASLFAKTSSFATAKAERRPKDVRPKATPVALPSADEEWKSCQKRMADDCDEAYNRYLTKRLNSASDHEVNQTSVSDFFEDGSYFQVRPNDNTGDEMRVYLKTTDTNVQYWARGLSHDQNRRAVTFFLYRRNGKTFAYVAGRRLERHVAAGGL